LSWKRLNKRPQRYGLFYYPQELALLLTECQLVDKIRVNKLFMLNERQQNLLKLIIESYINEAQPIASGLLAAKIRDKVSPATIRNEMVNLEKDGYIMQPHTSAGRIPTEKAYQFYLQNFVEPQGSVKFSVDLDLENDRLNIKKLAKELAEESKQAVLVAFTENDNYYTGISNLFSQPEFQNQSLVINLSSMIDHLDKVIIDFFENRIEDVEVLIGNNNPIGCECSALVSHFNYERFAGVLVILGPMRMNYNKNLALIRKAVNLLQK
jgi:transcriptional regulator of heat shock response